METNNSNVTISKSEYDRLRFIEEDYERKKDEIDSGLRKYKEELYDMVYEKLDNCDDISDITIYKDCNIARCKTYICTSRDKIIQKLIETLGIRNFTIMDGYRGATTIQIGDKIYSQDDCCSDLILIRSELFNEVRELERKKNNLKIDVDTYKSKLEELVKDKVKNDIKEGKVENRSVLQKIKDLIKTFD